MKKLLMYAVLRYPDGLEEEGLQEFMNNYQDIVEWIDYLNQITLTLEKLGIKVKGFRMKFEEYPIDWEDKQKGGLK